MTSSTAMSALVETWHFWSVAVAPSLRLTMQSAFPEPPASKEALDEQQRALLFEQERQLKAMKVGH